MELNVYDPDNDSPNDLHLRKLKEKADNKFERGFQRRYYDIIHEREQVN
jgi:hypothetical protein